MVNGKRRSGNKGREFRPGCILAQPRGSIAGSLSVSTHMAFAWLDGIRVVVALEKRRGGMVDLEDRFLDEGLTRRKEHDCRLDITSGGEMRGTS